MVASLAKQAHEATLVERLQHAEKVKELEERIYKMKVEEKEENIQEEIKADISLSPSSS